MWMLRWVVARRYTEVSPNPKKHTKETANLGISSAMPHKFTAGPHMTAV